MKGHSPLVRTNQELTMSKKKPALLNYSGHLADYRLPDLEFAATEISFQDVQAAWTAFQEGREKDALTIAVEALAGDSQRSNEEKAALNLAIAGAEYKLGGLDAAEKFARRSLSHFPRQFSANRILVSVLTLRKQYQEAYRHMVDASLPKRKPRWDEGLSIEIIELSLASWAWNCKAWTEVSMHLSNAAPEGLSSLPESLVEDAFRLSLYLESEEDAAAAADRLIQDKPVEMIDQLLQTIVKSGWTRVALPLYRAAFQEFPTDNLLRRRLVGLCIREGQLEEARTLAKGGGLRTAA